VLSLAAADLDDKFFLIRLGFASSIPTPAKHPSNVGVTGFTLLHLITNNFLTSVESTQLEATLPNEPRSASTLLLSIPATQPQSVIRQRPSLVTLWIGANDALGVITKGHISPSGIGITTLFPGNLTELDRFTAEYEVLKNQMLAIKEAYGTDVLFVTVPKPTSIPHEIEFEDLDGDLISDGPIGKTPLGHKIRFIFPVPPFVFTRDVTSKVEQLKIKATFLGAVSPDDLSGMPYMLILTSRLISLFGVIPIPSPSTISVRVTPAAFDRFLTDPEIDAADARVEDFNSIIATAVTSHFQAPFDSNDIFTQLGAELFHIKPTWLVGGDPSIKLSKDFMSQPFVKEKAAGAFSGDGIHPTPTAHAYISDLLIKKINTNIGAGSFGGFLLKIPRINKDSTISEDQFNAVANDDDLLKHIYRKSKGLVP